MNGITTPELLTAREAALAVFVAFVLAAVCVLIQARYPSPPFGDVPLMRRGLVHGGGR